MKIYGGVQYNSTHFSTQHCASFTPRESLPFPPTPKGKEAEWAPEPGWKQQEEENLLPCQDSNHDSSVIQPMEITIQTGLQKKKLFTTLWGCNSYNNYLLKNKRWCSNYECLLRKDTGKRDHGIF